MNEPLDPAALTCHRAVFTNSWYDEMQRLRRNGCSDSEIVTQGIHAWENYCRRHGLKLTRLAADGKIE